MLTRHLFYTPVLYTNEISVEHQCSVRGEGMNINELLASTRPIIYETESEEYPYALSGTCYPVKYNGTLFIVSANHCYENFGIEPDQTLYPIPDDTTHFFAYDMKYRAKADQAADTEHYDHVLLRVAASHHSQDVIDKVVALDLAQSKNSKLPTSSELKDFVIRGFPFDAPRHGIDYDLEEITEQAYVTNGCLGVGTAPYDYCYSIQMISPIPIGMHPNGMSGTPVYGVTYNGDPVYCGTIVKYRPISGEYMFIGPEIIINIFSEL